MPVEVDHRYDEERPATLKTMKKAGL